MARPSSANSTSSAKSNGVPEHETGSGSRKIHYNPHAAWDFLAATDSEHIDLNLMLPHYRAHNQPLHHRMGMYIHSRHGEIKAKVCRKARSPFLLSVHSQSGAPVTVYLPSDFSGTVRLPSPAQKLHISAGFSNHIRPRVHFTASARRRPADPSEDELEIHSAGPVHLRMWDVCEGAPEKPAREAWRKLCRASAKNLRVASETSRPMDWDFLLDD